MEESFQLIRPRLKDLIKKISESFIRICEKIPIIQFVGAVCRFIRANEYFSEAATKTKEQGRKMLLASKIAEKNHRKGLKELGRGFVALVPVVGSLALIIYDLFKKRSD